MTLDFWVVVFFLSATLELQTCAPHGNDKGQWTYVFCLESYFTYQFMICCSPFWFLLSCDIDRNWLLAEDTLCIFIDITLICFVFGMGISKAELSGQNLLNF